ncbi:MAG: 50S ribosomal protein L9 [Candidatus Xenobiia bacterium LiM19]
MKVILIADVEKLGDKGAILEVKNGYARNFLIPNSLAVMATQGNLKTWENEKRARDKRAVREFESAREMAAALAAKTITIKAKAGEEGKLYGSVTNQDIQTAVEAQAKIQIDKKKIDLEEPIKNTGSYTVKVKLSKGVIGDITVEVVPE